VKIPSRFGAFNCPHCGAYADQRREAIYFKEYGVKGRTDERLQDNPGAAQATFCRSCSRPAIWLGTDLIYPRVATAPQPNEDMPQSVRQDYEEARNIADISPRGAAALLRLAVEKLCRGLVKKDRGLHINIGSLVELGLPQRVQKALDGVRVIGNEAVHPGKIDLNDDRDTALSLFMLVNIIVERMISEEKKIQEIYEMIPDEKIEGIKQRDSKDD
jgi:hypothetical protein